MNKSWPLRTGLLSKNSQMLLLMSRFDVLFLMLDWASKSFVGQIREQASRCGIEIHVGVFRYGVSSIVIVDWDCWVEWMFKSQDLTSNANDLPSKFGTDLEPTD